MLEFIINKLELIELINKFSKLLEQPKIIQEKIKKTISFIVPSNNPLRENLKKIKLSLFPYDMVPYIVDPEEPILIE